MVKICEPKGIFLYILPIENENQKAYNITIKRGTPQETEQATGREGKKMNKTVEVNFWKRMDNPEVMGSAVADKARQIAEFIESLELVYYDTYVTSEFSGYVEGIVRGYQTNEQAYDDLYIATTLDLHIIQFKSVELGFFLSYLKERWSERLEFAREQGI